MRPSAGLAAGLLVLLSGCVQPRPLQVPLLAVDAAPCDARPVFGTALPVQVGTAGTSAVLGAAGRCLLIPGGTPTTYAAFALPQSPAPYTLDINSIIVPGTLVRPVARLYDAAGQLVRTVPPEEFEPNITGLRAGVRPRGTERWLVVAADQSRLGQTFEVQLGGIDGRVQTAAVIIILPVIPPPVPDMVRQRRATYALNGRIVVVAVPARTAQ